MNKEEYRLKTCMSFDYRCTFKIQRKVWWGWKTVWKDGSLMYEYDKITLQHAKEMLKEYRGLEVSDEI